MHATPNGTATARRTRNVMAGPFLEINSTNWRRMFGHFDGTDFTVTCILPYGTSILLPTAYHDTIVNLAKLTLACTRFTEPQVSCPAPPNSRCVLQSRVLAYP